VVRILSNQANLAARLLALALLAGCSSNGLSQNPPVSQGNLNLNKLALAVGTARLPDGTVGLNVVATYRQPNGFSGTLLNTPSLTGPSGFVVSTTAQQGDGFGGSGTDGGTAHITGSAQTPNPLASPPPTTFGQIGGVFASGFAPFNDVGTGGQAYYPGHTPNLGDPYKLTSPTPTFFQPFYYTATPQRVYIGGPPAYPFFNDGTYPNGFAGYLPGFTTFALTAVSGNYTLSVNVPAVNAVPVTQTATAALNSTTALPPMTAPSFTSDGAGGGSGVVIVPSDPSIVETLVFIVDRTASLYYTVGPIAGAGSLPFTLPDNEGPCATKAPRCTPGPTMSTGDSFRVYAASFDYRQLEAEPPFNTTQTPTLAGANGQSDLTLSPALRGTY